MCSPCSRNQPSQFPCTACHTAIIKGGKSHPCCHKFGSSFTFSHSKCFLGSVPAFISKQVSPSLKTWVDNFTLCNLSQISQTTDGGHLSAADCLQNWCLNSKITCLPSCDLGLMKTASPWRMVILDRQSMTFQELARELMLFSNRKVNEMSF